MIFEVLKETQYYNITLTVDVTFIRAVYTIDLGGFCMIFSVEQEPTNERPVWWWPRSNEETVLRCQSVQYKQLD